MGTTISIIDEILQDREKGAARLVAEYGERLYGRMKGQSLLIQ